MSERFYENLCGKLGSDAIKKIERARIGIAGAGGLGSNCAANLVRVGAKCLTIVDFDKVEPSNLDRQFYFLDQVGMLKVEALRMNLLRINPALELKTINKKIGKDDVKDLFRDCDIVAECLDIADAKRMLVEELMRLNKFIVSASGLGGVGASDEIKTHTLKKNLIIIGDLTSDISCKPALAPRVNVAAAKQADAILYHLLAGYGGFQKK